MKLYSELEKRALPPIPPREEIKRIIQNELFGYLPKVDFTASVSEPNIEETRYMCGEVEYSSVQMTVTVGEKSHSFQIDRLLHTDKKKRPLVIVNNFHPMRSSHYFPIEEMSEYDCDYLLFCYKDVTSDDGDFSNGLAALLLPNGQDSDTASGKIGIWAWAAMRVLDYGLTLEGTDEKNVAIAGHSRLGKTALFTALMDERFKFAFSNAAGCAGDSLAHGCSGHSRNEKTYEKGELISDIVETFPYWFCKNYRKYTKNNYADTFDQHFLLAGICPRYVLIGSCDLDLWADPESQQLCALASSEAWEKSGLSGLEGCDSYLEAGCGLISGHVGFFKIHSMHFLSRHSWNWFMKFLNRHKGE